jgi:hypothetical protein
MLDLLTDAIPRRMEGPAVWQGRDALPTDRVESAGYDRERCCGPWTPAGGHARRGDWSTRGIGAAIVCQFLEAGAKVLTTARSEGVGHALGRELCQGGRAGPGPEWMSSPGRRLPT